MSHNEWVIWHNTSLRETWLLHYYVRHDSLTTTWDMTPSLLRETWLPHYYMRYDTFIVWHDAFIVWHGTSTYLIWLPTSNNICVWSIHVTCLTDTRSCNTSNVSHDSSIYASRIIYVCPMTHPYMCHDPFMYVTRLIYIRVMAHVCMWHDSFIYVSQPIYVCVPRLSYICAMTHLGMEHDSSMYVPWSIYVCDTTHLYLCHDPFMYLKRLIYIRAMTHLCMWHDSSICVTRPIHICAMTHSYTRNHSSTGKSTLLWALAGRLELLAGKRKITEGLRLGFFTQDLAQELDPSRVALEIVIFFFSRSPFFLHVIQVDIVILFRHFHHVLHSKLYFFSCPVPFLFICHTNWHFDFLLSFPSRFALEIKK